MTDPSFSPYENIIAGLRYGWSRYAPEEYARWYTLTPEQKVAEIAARRRVRDAERAAGRDKAEFAHYKALADSLGLRRAVLELHAPMFEEFGAKPRCSGCYDSDYGHDDWPCETYVLARDWTEGTA
jgi:hypothetical protein